MNLIQWLATIRFTYLGWKNREELSYLPGAVKQAFKEEVIEPMKTGYNTPIEVIRERERLKREQDKPMRICVCILIAAITIIMIGAAILGS